MRSSLPHRSTARHPLAAAALLAGGQALARDLVVALKTEPTSMDPQYHALTPNYPLVATNLANLPVLSSKAAAGPAPEGRTTTELNAGTGLVGAGPYRFVAWKRGTEIVFERNPHYWGKAPAWDRVVYRPISNPAARVAALLAGDVDLAEDPPTDDLERLRKEPKLNVVTLPSNRIIYVALDQHGNETPGIQGTGGKNPLLDRQVREALSLAIDRKALVDRIMGGVATPAAQLLPAPMLGSSKKLLTAAKADPDKARALLKASRLPGRLHAGAGRAQRAVHQ